MKLKNRLLSALTWAVGASAVTAVINKWIKASAVSKHFLSDSNSLCYKWRFGNIRYTKNGSGRPLLLIHDLTAFSSSCEWSQLLNYLKDQYTVFTIDLLGCGRSEKPDLTYTNYLYVQLLSDFIKSEIGHRTNVVSTGSSSSFVVMTCNQSSELFDKIMLINPDSLSICSQIPNKNARFYKFILKLPIMGTLLYHIASGKRAIAEEFTQNYYNNPYSVNFFHVDAYYESAHLGESPKSLYASVRCNYTKCSIVNALKNIDNSIYIVGGMQLNSVKQLIQEYHDINPSIESSVISESKQLPQLEKPKELYEIIQFFFHN